MKNAFDRLRVVDFTTTIAGPHCTRLLSDLGAEIIKIEPPEGDMMRARPPLRNGASTSFGQLNTGKKSVVLDLKQPAATEIVRRLVRTADVLVENFRPGVMRRFGLDYPALREVKPDLIYCAISGYGQTGPSAALPAYAPVIHASSGYDMAHLAYQGVERRPDYCGIYIADVLTGTYAFGAIMAALYQRRETGDGPDDRHFDARKHAEPDAERDTGCAVSGDAAGTAVLRADRDRRRLCQSVDRQRAHIPESGRRLRPEGLDRRSAFREIPGPAGELGHADRRAGGVVATAHERRGAGDLRPARRAGLAVSHGATRR